MGNVIVKKEFGKCYLKFQGDLVRKGLEDFSRAYIMNKDEKSFVLDFEKVKRFDSAGVGMMLDMRVTVVNPEEISIINASDDLKDKLENFRLDTIFKIL